jgi:hypothetical protein
MNATSHATLSGAARLVTPIALVVALTQATLLVRAWLAWRSGVLDVYPDQHQQLVASAARGGLLALALPVPLLVVGQPARGRRALWALWAVAALGWVALFWWR